MRKTEKTIITCAPTGSIHTPSMSPHLPITPAEIAKASVDAAEAGAAILHLHARHPETGEPSPAAKDFMAFLPHIKQQCDAVINVSTGGSAVMSLEDRLDGAKTAQPELASLNMGPLIFDFSGAARRVEHWQHAWERQYVETSDSRIMYNDNAYIRKILEDIGQAFGTQFEFECYDIGHLYTLAHHVDSGLIKPPFLIQGVFGILGGIAPDPHNVAHMVSVADRLFGDEYMFSAFAAGKNQMDICTQSVLLGGHVRVGLEDSLFIGKGELATSNSQQVTKIRGIIEALGREIASPQEAREYLGLKGADRTAF